MNSEFQHHFFSSHDDSFFTRAEVAVIRRCSIHKLEMEAHLRTGIPFINDGKRCLYRKKDIIKFMDGIKILAQPKTRSPATQEPVS